MYPETCIQMHVSGFMYLHANMQIYHGVNAVFNPGMFLGIPSESESRSKSILLGTSSGIEKWAILAHVRPVRAATNRPNQC